MATCVNKETNEQRCTCTNTKCDKHGVCCECISYHWAKKQLPGCLFPKDEEKTFDRSLDNFIKIYSKG